MHSRAVTQESQMALQCSDCALVFKSKVYLYEHLHNVHGFSVDAALLQSGLKQSGIRRANPDDGSAGSGNVLLCKHCGSEASHRDVLGEHEKLCQKKAENLNSKGNLYMSENPETKITVTSSHWHTDDGPSTSNAECIHKSSKDLKAYKRPLQTITKYLIAPSGSSGNSPGKSGDSSVLLDSTKGTLILQESPSSSSPKSSGVFKVTATSMIDVSRNSPHQFLINDHLVITDVKSHNPKEEVEETVAKNAGKRTNDESLAGLPAKKAKSCEEETKPSDRGVTSFFEVSEDDDEEEVTLGNGDTESPKNYFCKHCDYSSVSIKSVFIHYQNDHPCVRYNAVYIQDPCDQSATFRCLECPVEFLSVDDLKRHYLEDHPEAPDVFKMQPSELCLLYKCFACRFTTNLLKTLKEHYKEMHPTHKVDNSLLYCRYSMSKGQESELSTCEKAPSPERSGGNSPNSACTPCEEVKNASSTQHPASRGADAAMYYCNNCDFSHKSVIVMHVHYQKSHPDESVTIDKIKQLHATSDATSEKLLNAATIVENCHPQENSEASEKANDKADLSQLNIPMPSLNLKHTPEASESHLESPKRRKRVSRGKTNMLLTMQGQGMSSGMDSSPDKIYYCRFCSYTSTKMRSIVGHHYAKHYLEGPTSVEEVLCYSIKLQKQKPHSEAKTSEGTPSSDSKQVDVYSKKELQCKEDNAVDASLTAFNPYQCAEKLFYCQVCNFANPSVKGVLNHQSKTHRSINSRECILNHTALIRKEIEQFKSHTKELSFGTHLPLPLMNEGDENRFFCHLCNYRHSTVEVVLRHYFKRHHGSEGMSEQIHLYTSLVLEQTQKLHLRTAKNEDSNHAATENKQNQKKTTKKPAKCFLPSSSVRASQTKRILQCHRCTFVTQYVYLLRRHMWKVHKSNRSSSEVLRVCFNRGHLQPGYHCDLCVFSNENAAAVYEHYQAEHPDRKLSLEYISTRFYVGPSAPNTKREKLNVKHTNGVDDSDGAESNLTPQRSGEKETKTYSCKACSFKCHSMSGIAQHYRAVHPWSVKEDGSVLGGIISKKQSANSQLEDQNNIPELFDTYQIPLEFDKSPDSPQEATTSPTEFKCTYCPVTFHNEHSLETHCRIAHQEGVAAKSDEHQDQQSEIQTRVHVFKCPHCAYINSNYHGVLTHCQMRHPVLESRADSLHVDEKHLHGLENSLKKNSPGDSLRYRGYMCKTCQHVCATVEKMNRHYEKEHNGSAQNTGSNLEPAPKPLTIKIPKSNTYSAQGSESKISFLSKRIYAVVKCGECSYSCSTNIALSRHMLDEHGKPAVSGAKDCVYSCVLCSRFYPRKRRLGIHYSKKHGRDAFLKYYVPVYKKVMSLKSASSDCPSTQQPESTSQACQSSTRTDENKILVYKCPACPYVNASYHGTLTHCQMTHPDLVVRADGLHTDEILVTNMVNCKVGKGSNERGFMCSKCPQIHASLVKLKIHCKRDHNKAEPGASAHSDEEMKEQSDHRSVGSVLKVATKTCQSNVLPVQNKDSPYKCHMCTYKGSCRKYLYCHYKFTHKLDAFSMRKLLEKYDKYKRKFRNPAGAQSEGSAPVRCKTCPSLTFGSSQLLIAHYSTIHRSDCKMDFTVLAKISAKSTGIYKCDHCKKRINGIRNLSCHLDRHRTRKIKMMSAAETQASAVFAKAPEAKPSELGEEDELPMLDTVKDLAQWNVTPVETFTLPASPLSSPSELEQPEQESREDKHTCKQCRRTFKSLNGLRSHEHSHAALAAIKKMDRLPPSAVKHKTTVLDLWKSHFVKNHQDVLMGPGEAKNQDEECAHTTDKESLSPAEENYGLPELDEEPEMAEKSLYSEPPDVQRQLNQYSVMAQTGVSPKENLQENMSPESSLLQCELCNFNSGHLSSIRRHYLNRHGKKIHRCKDCDFFTGIRKTLEMHMETGHATFQSEPTHQKDLRCPFCLYQTKNKNNMIDHIVLHREERVVPIEVRRPKLSRYLQGIVFRCHKCTFTSGSAENLHLHMMRHSDFKPYKCRLCYFDCTQLSDLEAHLTDKHQVMRNHELVGQVSLDQLEANAVRKPGGEEESPEQHISEHGSKETEEFDRDSSEVLYETLTKSLAQTDIGEQGMQQMKEADEKHEQEPQEQEGVLFLTHDAVGQGTKNADKGKNVQFKDFSGPERQRENQAQRKQRDGEDGSIKFTPPTEAAAEWSSLACSAKLEKSQSGTPHIKAPQHRINTEARVKDDLLHRNVELDKTDQDRTVKMEQKDEPEVVDKVLGEIQCLDEEGSISSGHSKDPANVDEISSLEKKNHKQTKGIGLKVERESLTSLPSCAQLKTSHKGNSGVPVVNCKEEVQSHTNCEEETDSYREMPEPENAFVKEEMSPLQCSKEEEDGDHFEQKQDRKDKMIAEGENQRRGQEREEGGRTEEADYPHVCKGPATGGAAEVLSPSATGEKLYTCEFCGRNFLNSHELARHVMRHGI